MAEHYASGSWHVKEGSEQDFITRWRDWLNATAGHVDGFGSATLLQDAGDPQHFVSFSDWDGPASREAWKAGPEFASGMSACRELCDDFQGGDFSQVAGV